MEAIEEDLDEEAAARWRAPAIKVARRELRGGRPSPSFTFLKNLTCKLSSPRYNLKLAFVLLLLASIENDVD